LVVRAKSTEDTELESQKCNIGTGFYKRTCKYIPQKANKTKSYGLVSRNDPHLE